MLFGRPWIHDTEAVPSSLYQKVQFPHEGAIVTIYGDTLTIPNPIFGIQSKKEPITLDGFEIKKPRFERRTEEIEKIPMDLDPYGNNNMVAMMRKMSYFPRMSLGKIVKGVAVQAPTIPTATPPFGLGYKPTDEDLLEMELKKMAHAKAKGKGLPSPPEPLKPYNPILNGNSIKVGDCQRYWGFLESRYDLESKTMLLGFELFLNYDAMTTLLDDAMTTLLGDAIFNIEEGEYQEVCQHALKEPYEARIDDEDDKEGKAPGDDDEGSDSADSNSDDSKDSDNEDNNSDDNEDSDGGCQVLRLQELNVLELHFVYVGKPRLKQ